jgi:hypothetical protein
MNEGKPSSRNGGGFLIAISTLIGTGVGVGVGQPSIGILGGVGLGCGLALLLWWRDRSR